MIKNIFCPLLCGLGFILFSPISQASPSQQQSPEPNQAQDANQGQDLAFCSRFDTFTPENASLTVEKLYETLEIVNSNRSAPYQLDNGNIITLDPRGENLYQLFQNCLRPALNKNIITFLSDEEINTLFDIIHYVFRHNSYRENIIDSLEKIIDFEVEHNRINDEHLSIFYRDLIAARQFDQARDFYKVHNIVNEDKVPEIIKINHKGRKIFEARENQLVETGFNFPEGGHIVIVSSAYCGPSRRFRAWLDSHPDKNLTQLVTNNTTWIESTDGGYKLEHLVEYNEAVGPHKIYIIESESDWPEIKSWATPELYFYEDGVLMAQLVGWPPEGREQELKETLKYITLK